MPRALTIGLLAALALSPFTSAPTYALPDAQLLRILAEGGDFREGDRVPLQVEVRNAGDTPLPPLPVTLTVDFQPYTEWQTPPDLPPAQTATWSTTWYATRGSFPFHATVDPFNELRESDETNNTTFINIGAGAAPEPSPWPAITAGLLSFAAAAGLGFLISTFLRPRRQAKTPSRPAPGPRSHSSPH